MKEREREREREREGGRVGGRERRRGRWECRGEQRRWNGLHTKGDSVREERKGQTLQREKEG